MNATARAARRTIAHRSATTRAQARIHRRGQATLAVYATAAGLAKVKDAQSMAGSLRTVAKRIAASATEGTAFRKGAKRDCRRYDRLTIHVIAANYAPRRPEYRAARNYLLSI